MVLYDQFDCHLFDRRAQKVTIGKRKRRSIQVRVLQAGASVEQHHRLVGLDPAALEQRDLGGQARAALGRGKDAGMRAHQAGVRDHRGVG